MAWGAETSSGVDYPKDITDKEKLAWKLDAEKTFEVNEKRLEELERDGVSGAGEILEKMRKAKLAAEKDKESWIKNVQANFQKALNILDRQADIDYNRALLDFAEEQVTKEMKLQLQQSKTVIKDSEDLDKLYNFYKQYYPEAPDSYIKELFKQAIAVEIEVAEKNWELSHETYQKIWNERYGEIWLRKGFYREEMREAILAKKSFENFLKESSNLPREITNKALRESFYLQYLSVSRSVAKEWITKNMSKELNSKGKIIDSLADLLAFYENYQDSANFREGGDELKDLHEIAYNLELTTAPNNKKKVEEINTRYERIFSELWEYIKNNHLENATVQHQPIQKKADWQELQPPLVDKKWLQYNSALDNMIIRPQPEKSVPKELFPILKPEGEEVPEVTKEMKELLEKRQLIIIGWYDFMTLHKLYIEKYREQYNKNVDPKAEEEKYYFKYLFNKAMQMEIDDAVSKWKDWEKKCQEIWNDRYGKLWLSEDFYLEEMRKDISKGKNFTQTLARFPKITDSKLMQTFFFYYQAPLRSFAEEQFLKEIEKSLNKQETVINNLDDCLFFYQRYQKKNPYIEFSDDLLSFLVNVELLEIAATDDDETKDNIRKKYAEITSELNKRIEEAGATLPLESSSWVSRKERKLAEQKVREKLNSAKSFTDLFKIFQQYASKANIMNLKKFLKSEKKRELYEAGTNIKQFEEIYKKYKKIWYVAWRNQFLQPDLDKVTVKLAPVPPPKEPVQPKARAVHQPEISTDKAGNLTDTEIKQINQLVSEGKDFKAVSEKFPDVKDAEWKEKLSIAFIDASSVLAKEEVRNALEDDWTKLDDLIKIYENYHLDEAGLKNFLISKRDFEIKKALHDEEKILQIKQKYEKLWPELWIFPIPESVQEEVAKEMQGRLNKGEPIIKNSDDLTNFYNDIFRKYHPKKYSWQLATEEYQGEADTWGEYPSVGEDAEHSYYLKFIFDQAILKETNVQGKLQDDKFSVKILNDRYGEIWLEHWFYREKIHELVSNGKSFKEVLKEFSEITDKKLCKKFFAEYLLAQYFVSAEQIETEMSRKLKKDGFILNNLEDFLVLYAPIKIINWNDLKGFFYDAENMEKAKANNQQEIKKIEEKYEKIKSEFSAILLKAEADFPQTDTKSDKRTRNLAEEEVIKLLDGSNSFGDLFKILRKHDPNATFVDLSNILSFARERELNRADTDIDKFQEIDKKYKRIWKVIWHNELLLKTELALDKKKIREAVKKNKSVDEILVLLGGKSTDAIVAEFDKKFPEGQKSNQEIWKEFLNGQDANLRKEILLRYLNASLDLAEEEVEEQLKDASTDFDQLLEIYQKYNLEKWDLIKFLISKKDFEIKNASNNLHELQEIDKKYKKIWLEELIAELQELSPEDKNLIHQMVNQGVNFEKILEYFPDSSLSKENLMAFLISARDDEIAKANGNQKKIQEIKEKYEKIWLGSKWPQDTEPPQTIPAEPQLANIPAQPEKPIMSKLDWEKFFSKYGKKVLKAVNEGKDFDDIYVDVLEMEIDEVDLTDLLLGMFLSEITQATRVNDKIKIGKKYEKFSTKFVERWMKMESFMEETVDKAIANNIYVIKFYGESLPQKTDKPIPWQTLAQANFIAKIKESRKILRETQAKGEIPQERNGFDQINHAVELIKKECIGHNLQNPAKDLKDNFDTRLHSILYAWSNNDLSQLKPQDYQHLANLLTQKVTPGQIRTYEQEPLALRNQQKHLKAEAYQHAFGSIAEEVYRALDEDQRKLVDALKGKDTNYFVDVRTDKEKMEANHIFKELAPKNLLKILVMLWGGAWAALNAIASKGNMLSNEYFLMGTTVSAATYMDLTHRPLIGGEFYKTLEKTERAKRIRPFKKAKEVNGEEVANKDISLAKYMKQKPKEVAFLKENLGKKGELSKLMNASVDVKINQTPQNSKGEKIPVITAENLKDGTKNAVDSRYTATIKDGYERYLFYKAVESLGIKTLAELEEYESVERMSEKQKTQVREKKKGMNDTEEKKHTGKIDESGLRGFMMTAPLENESGEEEDFVEIKWSELSELIPKLTQIGFDLKQMWINENRINSAKLKDFLQNLTPEEVWKLRDGIDLQRKGRQGEAQYDTTNFKKLMEIAKLDQITIPQKVFKKIILEQVQNNRIFPKLELREEVAYILALFEQETAYKPFNISKTWCLGLSQANAENYINGKFNPFQVKASILFGIKHIREKSNKFDKNDPDFVKKTIIAYNRWEGFVSKIIKKEGENWYKRMPYYAYNKQKGVYKTDYTHPYGAEGHTYWEFIEKKQKRILKDLKIK